MSARQTGWLARGARLGLGGVLLLLAQPATAVVVGPTADVTIDGIGATATVQLSIDVADGLEAADLRITFESAIVVPDADAQVAGVASACSAASNTATAGVLSVGIACQSALSGGGLLLTIPLRGVSVGSTTLSLTRCDLNEGALACTPGSASVTVRPPTPTPTATATFTRTATSTSTAVATSTVTRTSTATRTLAITRTPTRTRTSTPGGIGVPGITAPASGQVIGVEGVTFGWTVVAGATGYDLRVLNAATQAVLFSGSLNGNNATSSLISLPASGAYTFRVRACINAFTDASCGGFAARDFSVSLVAPSAAPTVTFPAAGALLSSSRQTLSWTTVAGNPALPDLFYEVRLSDLASGALELQLRTFHPTVSTDAVLRSGDYRLQVRACQAGCGPYSTPSDFRVSLGPVPSTAPGLPAVTVSGGNSLNASWSAVGGAEWYQVQVVQPAPAGPGGGALTVASRQVRGATSVTGLPVPTGLAYVIVAACNGDGCGPYSGGASINPAGPNPSLPNVGEPISDSVVSGPSVLFAWNRIPGDSGGNVTYRVYVQDLSRQSAALDVLTTQNYYGALLKAEGAKYAVVVIANPGLPSEVQGPGAAFTVRGTSAVAPTLIAPTNGTSLASGNVLMAWSPVPGATLYEYYVAVQGVSAASGRGVTPGLFVQVPLAAVGGQATLYSGIARACPAGQICSGGSDAGWGPWSNVAGTGGVSFTITP